jgi:hypothetical protein
MSLLKLLVETNPISTGLKKHANRMGYNIDKNPIVNPNDRTYGTKSDFDELLDNVRSAPTKTFEANDSWTNVFVPEHLILDAQIIRIIKKSRNVGEDTLYAVGYVEGDNFYVTHMVEVVAYNMNKNEKTIEYVETSDVVPNSNNYKNMNWIELPNVTIDEVIDEERNVTRSIDAYPDFVVGKKLNKSIHEATHQGKKVTLNKPMRGDVKKYKVYVTHPDTGNVVKVNFGDKDMEIKRDDPDARKSFRARHKCEGKTFAKDRHTAGYWSCRFWSSDKSVTELLSGK